MIGFIKQPQTWLSILIFIFTLGLYFENSKLKKKLERYDLLSNELQTLRNAHEIKIIRYKLNESGMVNFDKEEEMSIFGNTQYEWDGLFLDAVRGENADYDSNNNPLLNYQN